MNPTGPDAAVSAEQAVDRYYFFLSYAHSAPLPDSGHTDTDHWVSVFFRDLCAEVVRRARSGADGSAGFFDDLLGPGSDWKAVLASKLGAADVFVPLYSPGYFNKSWPLRERESFLRRLATSTPSPAEAHRHVVPVLWIPMPSWDRIPELGEALSLGAGVPEYAENGLRALCMLSTYRPQYTEILRRLARRIVEVAESSPLRPSRAPAIDDIPAALQTQTPFVVAVVAPVVAHLPSHRLGHTYGAGATQWRPFAGAQELPIAQYAANVAERLGLPTRIADAQTEIELLATCPAVLLIDPWIAAGRPRDGWLAIIAPHLHPWVTPLVVADRGDPQYAERGADLVAEVSTMLIDAGARRVKHAAEVEGFVQLMPAVVAEARRQYLRKAPVFPPKGPRPDRPRLTGPDSITSHRPGKNADD